MKFYDDFHEFLTKEKHVKSSLSISDEQMEKYYDEWRDAYVANKGEEPDISSFEYGFVKDGDADEAVPRWKKLSDKLKSFHNNFTDITDEEYAAFADKEDAILLDFLSPGEKEQLRVMLAKDKSFSDGEKLILMHMFGIPVTLSVLGGVFGMKHNGILGIEQKALHKLRVAAGLDNDPRVLKKAEKIRAANAKKGEYVPPKIDLSTKL